MKILKSTLSIISIIIITIIFVILTPSFWKNQIQDQLNKQLSQRGDWEVKFHKLNGHLLFNVSIDSLYLSNRNSSNVSISKVDMKLNFFKSLFAYPSLKYLKLTDLTTNLYRSSKSIDSKSDPFELKSILEKKMSIDRLYINGMISIPEIKIINDFIFDFDGKFHIDKNSIDLDVNRLFVSLDSTEFDMQLKDSKISLLPAKIVCNDLNGNIDSLGITGQFIYSWIDEEEMKMDLFIDKYEIPKTFFERLPLQPKFSALETEIHIQSDLKTFEGNITLSNDLGLNTSGNISLTNFENFISIDEVKLEGENASLSMNGIYQKNGQFNSSIKLTDFDINQWIVDDIPTDLNGQLDLEANIIESRLQEIILTMELIENKLYKDRQISIIGTVDYVNNYLNIEEPLELSIGKSKIIVTGASNFKDEIYNLDFDLDNADVFIINNFWSDSLESGKATGNLSVSGTFEDPDLNAELVLDDIKYKNFILESFEFFGNLNKKGDYTIGNCQLRIGNGKWNDESFESGVVDLSYSKEGIEIQSAEFKNNMDFFQLSGFLHSDGNGIFNRLQIATGQRYIINTKPVEFTLGEGVDLLQVDLGENELILKPFEFHVNDGIITGQLSLTDEVDGLLKVSNVGTDIIDFLIPEDLIINGQVFGEFYVSTVDYSLDYSIDVSIKNGEIGSQKFDELIISTFYSDSTVHIEDITLIHGDETGIQISGIVPQYYELDNPKEIDASINLKDIDISVFTQFVPNWFELDGLISGDIQLGGFPNKTKFDFDINIADAVFEDLHLGSVNAFGLYDSYKLYFNKFSAIRNFDHSISGVAYLPLDLNFSSENIGQYFFSDSMIVDVSGEFNHLEFLSHYLSDIDSIKGDHDISLTIYGTPNKLYRDGKILIDDATIYTILLDNPIEGIKGSGMLVKNLLTINNLSGHLKNNNENETDNLLVSGDFKMNKFFDPYYNLNIIGDNVFFKTLLGDIEGIVNLDLDIYGRDTITIAGQIEALDAIMYQEFQINDLPSSELDQDELIINYKLNFPISGKFVLRNSQIDAQLGGELSISMFGDQNADYSGELFVREGKFYYYGDIFTITSGYLAFDTKGFNPYLDLSAFTKIQDENITINLVGPLDNPNLRLESSSGFTESDILELLTIRSRFEDQEISSSGIGSQAQSIFVAYLEKELERNFMQISGLGKWGLIEDVSISGTSALIDPSRSQEDLVIKAQVSKNLSLNYSYKRSFSFSNAPYNQVGVELKVNPYFSLIGNVDELGNMHVKYRLRYSY
tara:strand:+ start:7154 stop:10963 length:3810 start_codon:yes stop_codon:yes gene_type:complete